MPYNGVVPVVDNSELLVAMAARGSGLSYGELVANLLAQAWCHPVRKTPCPGSSHR